MKEKVPHGKGKFTREDGWKWEGDWVNGEKEGHMEVYHSDGKLVYEG